MPLDEDEKHKIALEALLSETSRLGDAIAERHAAAERFVAVAGALVGVGLTLGLFQNQRAVLMGLPLTVIIIVIYMIQIYTDAGMHSGHRQALEMRLKSEFGYPIIVGQSQVAAKHATRPSVPCTLGLVAIIWLGTAVAGGLAVFRLFYTDRAEIIALSLYLLALVLALAVVIQAMMENRSAEKKAREAAMAAWSKPPSGGE
jgi:hypothetical protein